MSVIPAPPRTRPQIVIQRCLDRGCHDLYRHDADRYQGKPIAGFHRDVRPERHR